MVSNAQRACIVGVVLLACTPPQRVSDPPRPIAPPTTAVEPQPQPEPEPQPEPQPEPEPEPIATKPERTPPPGFEPIPAKRKGGFPGVEFTTVRAFAFDMRVGGQPICGSPLLPDGALCSTVEEPGVLLTPAQTKTLLAWVRDRKTYGDGSACYLPHHGFVFYDPSGLPIAELGICLMCDMMQASPSIPGARHDGETGVRYGLSHKATEQMRALCTELGLPKCDATNPEQFGNGR